MKYFDYNIDDTTFRLLEIQYVSENADYFDEQLDILEVSCPKEMTLTQKKVLLYDRLLHKSHHSTMITADEIEEPPARCVVNDGILYVESKGEIICFKGTFISARICYFSKDEKYCSILIKVADGVYKRSYLATCSIEDACMCAFLQCLYIDGNCCYGRDLSYARRLFILD